MKRWSGWCGSMLAVGMLVLACGAVGESRADDAAEARVLATKMLDESLDGSERDAALRARPDLAGLVITAMTEGLGADATEEYRRIPWIWRVAVEAGRRDQDAELVAVIESSLPQVGEPMRDWQSVVLGGGIVNGLTQAGRWPGERIEALLASRPESLERWKHAIKDAARMADDESIPTGTRYDALRMIAMAGWEAEGARLRRYLARGINDELQMGAISGCGDIDAYEASAALLEGMSWYSEGNRQLALEAMLRSASRAGLLLDAVERGEVARGLVTEEIAERLCGSETPEIAARAKRLFPK